MIAFRVDEIVRLLKDLVHVECLQIKHNTINHNRNRHKHLHNSNRAPFIQLNYPKHRMDQIKWVLMYCYFTCTQRISNLYSYHIRDSFHL